MHENHPHLDNFYLYKQMLFLFQFVAVLHDLSQKIGTVSLIKEIIPIPITWKIVPEKY